MPDTTKELPESVEVIENEIEQTRAGLADKLEALTEQLAGTVEGVGETVETVVESTKETISTIKDTFNIPKQVEERPWLAMGLSVAAGFVGGKILDAITPMPSGMNGTNGHAGSPPSRVAESMPQRMSSASTYPEGGSGYEQPHRESSPGWLSQLGQQFGSELQKAKGLAIGTMLGVIRDMVSQSLPESLKSQVATLFDSATEKMGGETIEQGSLVQDPANGS